MGGLSSATDGSAEGAPRPQPPRNRPGTAECLAPWQIERFAARAPISGPEDTMAAAHLAVCPRCAAEVAEAGETQRFLGVVGPLLRRAAEEVGTGGWQGARERGAPGETASGRSGSADGEPATDRRAARAPVDGRVLHGYRLLEPMGQGGQGTVWRAVHEPSGRPAAVKIVRFATPRERARMQREARLAAGLRHPGIVSIFDCGALPDAGFAIAMELVQGRPLDAWAKLVGDAEPHVRRRRLVRVVARICAALHHAHQHGVIHRDLKPGNILVGEDDQPRLVDFGLARSADSGTGMTLTRTGEFAGTLVYAAPEQVRGEARVGSPADVYSAGVVLYELVVGRLPHDGAAPIDGIVAAVLGGVTTVPSRTMNGEPIDRDLATVILKAVDRDAARRYESAAALRADLERWLDGQPVEARRASTWYLLGKLARRHRAAAAGAVVAVATLAAFAVVVTVLYFKADEAQRRFRKLFEAAKASTEQATQVYRQADQSLAEVSALYVGETQARRAAVDEARRLASELAAANRARARERAAAGDLDEARAIAWREALAPSAPHPGIMRVGTPRFAQTQALLRELYADDATATDRHVDEVIAGEVERWIERLAREGVAVTNVGEVCGGVGGRE